VLLSSIGSFSWHIRCCGVCAATLERNNQMYEATPRVIDAVQKLKGVFLEAPTTQMSLVDASRLSGLERQTTRLILEALEDAHFLRRASNGLFMRRSGDAPSS
jgi:hypothetical protein